MQRRTVLAGMAIATIATAAQGETSMQGTAALSDINAITAAVRAYEAHWNVGDLDAMAKLYAPDVHWVNVRGMHWRGFAEVDRAHRIYFDLMFKGVHNDLIEIESITPVTPDVIIAVVQWRFGAFTTPDGLDLLIQLQNFLNLLTDLRYGHDRRGRSRDSDLLDIVNLGNIINLMDRGRCHDGPDRSQS